MLKSKLTALNYFLLFNIQINFILFTILFIFTKVSLTQLASQSELIAAYNGEQNNIQNLVNF